MIKLHIWNMSNGGEYDTYECSLSEWLYRHEAEILDTHHDIVDGRMYYYCRYWKDDLNIKSNIVQITFVE